MDKNQICFTFKKDKMLARMKDGSIILPSYNDIQALGMDLSNLKLLKKENQVDFLFGEMFEDIEALDEFKFYNLRILIGSMENSIFNLAAKAFHLLKWNKSYTYCSSCGGLLHHKKDEMAKICPTCGSISYPRISPAIITAVIKDNKILLAHNTNFPNNMYSVVAGFLEPGETFEDCVSREVYEEVGISVKNIKYFGSQPWPFPDSLMVGFTCEYAGGELKVDGVEIDDAAFYSIDELPNIPLGGSIARRLIDWFISEKNKQSS